jgi:hypothetical protein
LYWNCCVWKWGWAIPTTRKKNPFIESGPTNIGGDLFGKVGGYTDLETKMIVLYKKVPFILE